MPSVCPRASPNSTVMLRQIWMADRKLSPVRQGDHLEPAPAAE